MKSIRRDVRSQEYGFCMRQDVLYPVNRNYDRQKAVFVEFRFELLVQQLAQRFFQ